MSEPFLVAAAQVAPAFLDLDACIEIACEWIAKAGKEGVKLLVFPETWLPGYPVWLDISPEAALWDHQPAKELFQMLSYLSRHCRHLYTRLKFTARSSWQDMSHT